MAAGRLPPGRRGREQDEGRWGWVDGVISTRYGRDVGKSDVGSSRNHLAVGTLHTLVSLPDPTTPVGNLSLPGPLHPAGTHRSISETGMEMVTGSDLNAVILNLDLN